MRGDVVDPLAVDVDVAPVAQTGEIFLTDAVDRDCPVQLAAAVVDDDLEAVDRVARIVAELARELALQSSGGGA